jgi:hypothetical protein
MVRFRLLGDFVCRRADEGTVVVAAVSVSKK